MYDIVSDSSYGVEYFMARIALYRRERGIQNSTSNVGSSKFGVTKMNSKSPLVLTGIFSFKNLLLEKALLLIKHSQKFGYS